MVLAAGDLINEFGRAAEIGNATLFVGAGLSRGSGLPDWSELLQGPADVAKVPMGKDLPLVAEYVLQTGAIDRNQLELHIRNEIEMRRPSPGPGHADLTRLPVDQIWTTNYDRLIEQAGEDLVVVEVDEDVSRIGASRRCVIKMHGSLADNGWAQPPVITRMDYETYQQGHPRMWALLRAAYLSRTMLFVGFSFTDPNIEILLRLARTLGTSVGDRHMTVMRRPPSNDQEAARGHDLRVRDLEASGVRVHEIADFEELNGLLAALVRRTRPQRLFLSGSFDKNDKNALGRKACVALATQIADRPGWTMVSMSGPAGWHLSQQVGEHRRADGSYNAGDFEFNFRKAPTPPVGAEERLGTFVYHDLTREKLVPLLLAECRALVVVGGHARTFEEIAWARDAGLGIVPLAASGDAAKQYWEESGSDIPELGGKPVNPATWMRLNNENLDVAARAARELLDQAMYHGLPE